MGYGGTEFTSALERFNLNPAIDRFRALHKLYGISLHNETALALVVVAEAIQENTEAIKACVKEIDYCGKKL